MAPNGRGQCSTIGRKAALLRAKGDKTLQRPNPWRGEAVVLFRPVRRQGLGANGTGSKGTASKGPPDPGQEITPYYVVVPLDSKQKYG